MEKKQSKLPFVRFPEFKERWEHKKLSELLKESKTKNKDLKYSKEEVLSVSGESGIVNQIEHLGRSYAGESVHNYGVVDVGDIVYTKSPLKANPYGIIKQNKHKAGIVSTLYAIYKVKDSNTYGEFIEHYFSLDANTNRYLRPLVKKGAKNDMKINNDYVLFDRIFVPKVEEQKKISSFINILDLKITQLNEKQTLLQKYKKGVIQKIFNKEIRFKDKYGKDFPKWGKKELGELLDYLQPTKFLVDSTEYDEVFETPVVTAGKTFILGFTNETYGIYDSCLPVIIFDDFTTATQFVDFKFKAKSSAMKILIPKKDVNLKFVYESMQLIKFEVGGHGRHWISVFAQLPIIYPHPDEQIKIEDFLSAIDSKINAVNLQIDQTKTYKKALLQQLFCN